MFGFRATKRRASSRSPSKKDVTEEERLESGSHNSSIPSPPESSTSRLITEQSRDSLTDEPVKKANLCTFPHMSSIRVAVLLILCLQNSLFTLVRRYSLGYRKESYSKYEVLLVGEVVKLLVSAWMIGKDTRSLGPRLIYLVSTGQKMLMLAVLYGMMNILSLVSLRNIGAGMFTIFAQCKILTTATFSTLLLKRQYTSTQWRALISLSLGVLLFSQPIWDVDRTSKVDPGANVMVGTLAVLIEVTLSGFSSIYFEKVIKTDPLQLTIWERNFQLAAGSIPVYMAFIAYSGDSIAAGWTQLAWGVALLGAAGGLLVALSIKYGDSILKTLATTGAIVLSSVLDYWFLDGPLTPAMMIAASQVVLAICNYTFDQTPPHGKQPQKKTEDLPENTPKISRV